MAGGELTALVVQSLWLSALLLLPVLIAAVVAGVASGSLQSFTQWHDASLAFVPKVALVTLVLALTGSWMFQQLTHYAEALWSVLPRVQF